MVLATGDQGKIKVLQLLGTKIFFGKFPWGVNLYLTDCS